MTHPLSLPVLGLVEDALLPGETRTFEAPSMDLASLRAAAALVGKPLCTVTVAHASELPQLVVGRWATRCTVTTATETSVTLHADARVKLLAVKGLKVPHAAEVEVHASTPPPASVEKGVLAGARAVLASLEDGALPTRGRWAEDVTAAVAALARAVSGTDGLAQLPERPLGETLARLADVLRARAPGERASHALETMARQVPADRADMPRDLRQRLWDQSVEILRALDVYDAGPGADESDLATLQKRLQQAGLPRDAREMARRELRLLRSMETRHHDYSTYRGHLDFMARLPWHPETLPTPDLPRVADALDREHTGMQQAKDRMLEFLAVRLLGGKTRSTVLCLAGPPGVGKTTLARSVAEALGRKFARVALGGVHDETEIRGHRMSFTAAAAGRILGALAHAGSCAPVMLLDELDKVGTDRQRSPVGALHEVLDPEQNGHFHDNYLGVPFDLSHVLFIATVNDLGQVNPTLRDRLEVVELEGYLAQEKVTIARRHVMPAVQAETGLPGTLPVESAALDAVVEGYTREAGVRQLRRNLDAIYRARALRHVRGDAEAATAPVDAAEVRRVLGPPRFAPRAVAEALPVGVAWGLSVGGDGGALMRVEAALVPGKGALALTGRAGDVLQESAQAALAHLRVHAARYGVDPARLQADVHVHLPEAAVPKDGPSAGVALVAALVSAALGRPLPAHAAMTGEITLHGDVLPVGGVKAKVLAAERGGATVVLVPRDNEADVPPDTRVRVVLIRTLADAWAALGGNA